MLKEFKEFAMKGNVLDMAIGVIIGGAFGKIVTSLVSDVLMPRLDGYQTCALIKKNTKFQNMPVIMLSSKDGLFDRARGRMVGSDQYLTKPFTKESLLKTVATHVNRPVASPVSLVG